MGFVEDLKVVGFGGHGFHGFQGGYPGFLVEDVGLELDQTGGGDTVVGVGFGVGTGSGVDVAPGPSPSQLMLYDGFPILI